MNIRRFITQNGYAIVAMGLFAASAQAALTDISSSPMSTGNAAISAKPNIMFMLDDSGSMDWDYMPDTAQNFAGKYGFNSSQCNGVYYNPSFPYNPPVKSDGTSYPNSSFTAAWTDGYAATGSVNLNTGFTGGSGTGSSGAGGGYTGNAFYYDYRGAQTTPSQKNYTNTSSTFYQECNSSINSTPGSDVFQLVTLSSAAPTSILTVSGSATITVNTANNGTVSSITVNGVQILNATTSSSKRTKTVASNIANGINACTSAAAGHCTTTGGTGYSATVSGSVVTIVGPGNGYTPAVTANNVTVTRTAFPQNTTVSSITVNGAQLLSGSVSGSSATALATAIRNAISASGYSATVSGSSVTISGPSSASTYAPVITSTPLPASGGLTLSATTFPPSTTAAQLQNFANWYSYYSTRMLTMKTGAGQAFAPISNSYRVGFMTMNNNVSPGFLDIEDFSGACSVGSGSCQKDKWYSKLYAANPGNSTPLREALSHVGQLYANKIGTVTRYTATITVGGSGNGQTVDDVVISGTSTMDNPSVAAATTSQVAQNIANQINAAAVSNYGASVSGSTITITGLAADAGTSPVIDTPQAASGGMTFSTTPFTASSTTAQLNGVTPKDPIQYACQQNFVILSTDGYWNGNTTYNLNNSTVGNQDSIEKRPMNDGAKPATQTVQYSTMATLQTTKQTQQHQRVDYTLQSQTTQLHSQTIQMQGQTKTLQKSVMYLQSSTSGNSGTTWTSWGDIGSCTWDTSGSSRTQCRYVTALGGSTVWSAGAATWTTAAGTCTTSFSSGTSGTWSGNGTSCQYTGWGVIGNLPSCTNTAPSPSSPYTVLTAYQNCTNTMSDSVAVSPCTQTATSSAGVFITSGVNCTYSSPPITSNPTSCTEAVPSPGSPYTVLTATHCSYASTTSNVATCTASTPEKSTASPYRVATAIECPITAPTSPVGVDPATCTSGVDGNGLETICTTTPIGPNAVASGTCTPATANAGNSWTATTCNSITVGPTAVASCTQSGPTALNSWHTTTCTAAVSGVADTLADVAEYYYINDLRTSALGNCTGTPITNPITGATSTLPVCNNIVPTTPKDGIIPDPEGKNPNGIVNNRQHMTTFTLGLGARGRMVFNSNYDADAADSCDPATDDYCAVLKGSTAIASSICTWQSPGTVCNWPTPSSNAIENIDDLWHAAVNGRGQYFSAADPGTLVSGLSSALKGIDARTGAAAAAATSNPNPGQGDNFMFNTIFMSVDWTGDVIRRTINLTTGVPSAIPDWNAQPLLDTLAAASANGGSRHIYTFNPGATGYGGDPAALNAAKLKSFKYANLTGAEQGYFSTAHIAGLHQFCAGGYAYCLSGTNQTNASGANLVNYLRGDKTNEGDQSTSTTFYRARKHILGDIVSAEPAYVRAPMFRYGDTNYSAYTSAQTNRQSMVYVASNDGMLHAFIGGTATITTGDGSGTEAWAYVPALVLPNLYLLADKTYSSHHQYFVDGTPITGDICPNAPSSACSASEWRTILVGGLNLGGRGYYALDVTDPANPKALWEFTDTNMGYTFGNPVITKLADGTWVVLLTSGYNNVSGGDGVGHLYVLNAATGTLIRSISTGVGDAATPIPSGLARINALVMHPASDNTAVAVYGGDLLGNLWRFDINNNVGNFAHYPYAAQLLATLQDASGFAQPITSAPQIGIVDNQVVVFAGTGSLLGSSDLTNTQLQSMYAMKDSFSTTSTPSIAIYPNPRASACATTSSTNCFVHQVASSGACPDGAPATLCQPGDTVRLGTDNPVSIGTQFGWFIDAVDSGERFNTDPALARGTLAFTSNTPSTGDACTILGHSNLWTLNYRTGGPVSGSSGVVSEKIADAFTSRVVLYTKPDGTVMGEYVDGAGNVGTLQPPTSRSATATRRTSWRELVN